jgi:hypothetical protein
MWYGHLARHRQDACATSFTSEMETLYNLLPITHYQLPITNYPLPITHYLLPITNYPLPITLCLTISQP